MEYIAATTGTIVIRLNSHRKELSKWIILMEMTYWLDVSLATGYKTDYTDIKKDTS